MTVQEKPIVEISPARLVCASHGEHFRVQWPKGFVQAGLKLFQAAVASDVLLEACGYDGDGKVPVERINDVTETRPLCYFVDRATIREALLEAGILTKQRCDICGVPREAGPYDIGQEDGGHVTRTVCVECALDAGEREHAARPEGTRR